MSTIGDAQSNIQSWRTQLKTINNFLRSPGRGGQKIKLAAGKIVPHDPLSDRTLKKKIKHHARRIVIIGSKFVANTLSQSGIPIFSRLPTDKIKKEGVDPKNFRDPAKVQRKAAPKVEAIETLFENILKHSPDDHEALRKAIKRILKVEEKEIYTIVDEGLMIVNLLKTYAKETKKTLNKTKEAAPPSPSKKGKAPADESESESEEEKSDGGGPIGPRAKRRGSASSSEASDSSSESD